MTTYTENKILPNQTNFHKPAQLAAVCRHSALALYLVFLKVVVRGFCKIMDPWSSKLFRIVIMIVAVIICYVF